MRADLEKKIRLLPTNPGIYVMLDADDTVIYVGKAKNLKNRVTQYFYDSVKTEKVMAMVAAIADFYYVITMSEADALSLENNYIKKYKPKYNILLKDDKTYPSVRIDLRQDFPYFEVVRRVKNDGARYFGPFMAGINANEIVEIINCTFLLRSCTARITEGTKKRECLEYHIKRCLAPCNGLCTKAEYRERVNAALDFLSGNDDEAERLLTAKMQAFSEAEEFELALSCRDKLKSLKKLSQKKITSLNRFISCDVIAFATDNIHSAVSVLVTRGGRMQSAKNFAFDFAVCTPSELIEQFVMRFYDKNNELPDELLINVEMDGKTAVENFFREKFNKRVTVICPKQGVKRQLVQMAETNAADYLEKTIDKIKHRDDMTVLACERLKTILGLKKYPKRIECYDISNISGVDKVGSMVVFYDGVKSPSDYRRFRIKTVEGADDFASLKEVLSRRIERAKTDAERFPAPDLVIIDGGKGQLSAVNEVFSECGFECDLISLAKREEEIFTLRSDEPVRLERRDYALQLLQRIRDEAHRFAITYHRSLHLKNSFYTELSSIRGLGKKRIDALLDKFGSVAEISAASVEELASVPGIGETRAQAIYDHFSGEE